MIDASMKQILADKAREETNKAYSPYSEFNVGCALLCKDGSVYTGCNIENASYSATMCAERVALFSAVKDGKREFPAIAIAGRKKKGNFEKCAPCGVCLQTLSEFLERDALVLLVNEDGYDEYRFSELLPISFSSSNLR